MTKEEFEKMLSDEMFNIRQNAIKDVQLAAKNESKWILFKIKQHSKKFGYDEKDVKQKIINDKMFASLFIKDPIKQSFHENFILKYLQTKLKKDVKKLPSRGNRSVRLTRDGEFCSENAYNTTKSFDFVEINGNKTILYVIKHTDGNGGAQDNQFADVVRFLNACRVYLEDIKVSCYTFVFLLDGGYYTDSVIDNLKSIYENDNIWIGRTYELK